MAVKLGSSSYSYQDEYYLGRMTLEDCIAHLSSVGGEGFELIPEEMLPGDNFMRLGDEFVDTWKGWMEKYKMTPTVVDIFDDFNLYENRTLTVLEQLERIEIYLKIAKRLGFFGMRVTCNTPMPVLEKLVPMGEYYGLKLGLEIHAPLSMKSEWADNWVNLIERTGTKYAGFIPDFGIFSKRPYTVAVDKAIRMGADPKICEYIVEQYKKQAMGRISAKEVKKYGTEMLSINREMREVAEKTREMGGGDLEYNLALNRNSYDDPKWLIEFMPYLVHVHAKFYEMQEDGKGGYVEPNIDHENVLPILRDYGYDGYLSSEYEGHAYYRDMACTVEPMGPEQVRRHHIMMRSILAGK